LFRSQIEDQVDFAVDRLVFNTAALEDSLTLEQAGLETESSIDALVALDGGKRKRKKKVYTKPKKIGHKHKKRSLALLEYYNVEASGKIKKLKNECDKCEVATYMADHPDRYTCGKCGHMLYRLTAKGERLPIPKQNKPAAAAVAAAPAKKDAKKKKK
jgi:small subunit ribosomal protein S27Ae